MAPWVFSVLMLAAFLRNSPAAQPVTGRDWFEAVPEIFTPRSNPGCVVLNNKLWVVGGDDGGPRGDVWSSADGKQWSRVSPRAFPPRRDCTATAFNGRIWVNGGYTISPALNYHPRTMDGLCSSADGINWSTVTTSLILLPGMDPFSAAPLMREGRALVVFKGALWGVGGLFRWGVSGWDQFFNDVWRSTDGATWQAVAAQAPFTARYGHATVAFNNRLWVIGGRDAGTVYHDVWSSADGVAWTSATLAAPFSPRFNHGCTVFAGRLWIIGGQDLNGKPNNEIWNSLDGASWQRITPTPVFQPREGCVCVVQGGQLWLIGGESDGNWHSADGVHWVAEPINHPGARRGQINLAFDGRLWIIGGTDWLNRDCRDAWSSPDGIHWTRVTANTVPVSYDLIGFSFNGAMWLKTYGNLFRSSDGAHWTTMTLPKSVNPDGDAGTIHNNRMVLINSSTVWSSPDGLNWTSVTQASSFGTRYDFAAASFKNRLWVHGGYVTGSRAYLKNFVDIWSSENGQAWTCMSSDTGAMSVGQRLESFAGRLWLIGGGFQPLAYDPGAGFVWSSTDGVNWTRTTSREVFPARFFHGSAILNNKLWVLGGWNRDGSLGDVWFTPGTGSSATPQQSGWPLYD